MSLTKTTYKKALSLIQVIKIGNNIITASPLVDDKTKEAFKSQDHSFIKIIHQAIHNNDLSAAALRSLINTYFTYWNESTGIHIEVFWNELKKNNLNFKRKDALEYALKHTRCRNVHQAMELKKNWNLLKQSQLLKDRLTPKNIELLDHIILQDEHKRVQLLKKCLAKKSVPKSQYLQFGDAMAYLEHCQLFEQYFKQSEYQTLYDIWNKEAL